MFSSIYLPISSPSTPQYNNLLLVWLFLGCGNYKMCSFISKICQMPIVTSRAWKDEATALTLPLHCFELRFSSFNFACLLLVDGISILFYDLVIVSFTCLVYRLFIKSLNQYDHAKCGYWWLTMEPEENRVITSSLIWHFSFFGVSPFFGNLCSVIWRPHWLVSEFVILSCYADLFLLFWIACFGFLDPRTSVFCCLNLVNRLKSACK